MEADFVNEYISRLIAKIHDLTGQQILLEARLAMAEKVSSNLQEQLKTLQPAEDIKKK